MKFEVEGYNLDDLIRKVHKKKIKIFNLNKVDEKKVEFLGLDKDKTKIEKLLRNYNHFNSGSVWFRLKNWVLSNLGIFVGILIGLVFYLVKINYICDIKIIGNENLKTSEILSVLGENGVKVGNLNRYSTEYIEDVLLNQYDMIAQASAMKRGTSIIINISEKLVYKDTEYQPIIAKYSGTIKEINLTTGTLNVSVGDYVNVGDILVLPYNLDAHGNRVSVVPSADIIAEMYVSAVTSKQKESRELVYTGREIICYEYKFKDFKLYKGKSKNSFDIFSLKVYNESISNLLPFSRDVYVYSEQQFIDVTNDLEKIKDQLIAESEQTANLNLPIGDIVSQKSYSQIINDTLYAYTNVIVLGEISANNQRTN